MNGKSEYQPESDTVKIREDPKLLTRQEVERARARVKLATTVLQQKDPSLQLAIETLTELADDLLAELQAFDEADAQRCDDLIADLQKYKLMIGPTF